MNTVTTPVTIRIPRALVKCATAYAQHHDLHSRNQAFNVALESFFADPRTPAERAADADYADLLATQADLRGGL